jgi:hypothetical protein
VAVRGIFKNELPFLLRIYFRQDQVLPMDWLDLVIVQVEIRKSHFFFKFFQAYILLSEIYDIFFSDPNFLDIDHFFSI